MSSAVDIIPADIPIVPVIRSAGTMKGEVKGMYLATERIPSLPSIGAR